MTRREAVLNAFYGALGGIVADWARLKFTVVPKLEREAKREPWVASVLKDTGHGVVRTASGKVAMARRRSGELLPVMTYEIICHLDGKPCPCAYANEATGVVMVYADGKDGAPIWKPSRLIRKTGRVELIPNLIG
jgi:hypothetical protein